MKENKKDHSGLVLAPVYSYPPSLFFSGLTLCLVRYDAVSGTRPVRGVFKSAFSLPSRLFDHIYI